MSDLDEKLYGRGLMGSLAPTAAGLLKQRFQVPPFSVLSARDGDWQKRKRAWLRLGLEGEVAGNINGRAASPGGSPLPAADYREGQRGDGRGRPQEVPGRNNNLTMHVGGEDIDVCRHKYGQRGLTGGINGQGRPARLCYGNADWHAENNTQGGSINSTSIFDPVLCELCYRWFAPPCGQVVDPFAGGAVRGIIAHILGLKYWGCDLRQEQIDSNEEQAARIVPDNRPTWACGDAREIVQDAPEAGFLFSCPPYGSLEQYSTLPADLSNMPPAAFRAAYAEVLAKAAARLKPDRFACFVVGDYREPDGCYAGFPAYTVVAARRAGLRLYNEAVLVTAVASASMRAQIPFVGSRKLCKTHQNILVFVKGCPVKAAENCQNFEK